MSAFTDRLYCAWLAGNGLIGSPRARGGAPRPGTPINVSDTGTAAGRVVHGWGYGAQPHDERPEGYPKDQTNFGEEDAVSRTTWRPLAGAVGLWNGSSLTTGVILLPKKPDVFIPCPSRFFTSK